jgi:hypothetical protein
MRKATTARRGRPGFWRCFFSWAALPLWLTACIALTGCTIGREPKHSTWTTATGAEQYERLMWQALRNKEWNQVDARLAPMFVGVNALGQSLDRAAWIEYWKKAPVREFALAEVAVRPNGADMTVSYVLRLGDAGTSLRVISVWQQVKKGWILTATSMTPLAPNSEANLAK